MQRLRDDLLARPVLAGDEDVRAGRANATDKIEHRAHHGSGGDEVGRAFRAENAVLSFQEVGAALGVVQLHLGAHNAEQAGVVPGLLNKVACAATHGVHREIDAGPGSHQNDGKPVVPLTDGIQKLQAFGAGGGVASVVEVNQQRVVVTAVEMFKNTGRGARRVGIVAFRAEKKRERFENIGLVVRNEQTGATPLWGGVGGRVLKFCLHCAALPLPSHLNRKERDEGGAPGSSLLFSGLCCRGGLHAGAGGGDGDVVFVERGANGALQLDACFLESRAGGDESGFRRGQVLAGAQSLER